MGRRGMSNLKRMINGSVSEYVLANAPCAYVFFDSFKIVFVLWEEMPKKK